MKTSRRSVLSPFVPLVLKKKKTTAVSLLQQQLLFALMTLMSVSNRVAVAETVEDVSCRSPSGDAVEWFVLYKLPGEAFAYIDSEMDRRGAHYWLRGADITSKNDNPIVHTLWQLFELDRETVESAIQYVVYNDQPPQPRPGYFRGRTASAIRDGNETLSNAKGVILSSPHNVVWLVHNIPRFPGSLFTGRYDFPQSELSYAHTAICVTLTANLDQLANHLRFNNPNIYDMSDVDELNEKLFLFDDASERAAAAAAAAAASASASAAPADGRASTSPKESQVFAPHGKPILLTQPIDAYRGTRLFSIAKNPYYNREVYETRVAGLARSGLLIKSSLDMSSRASRLQSHSIEGYTLTNVSEMRLNLGSEVRHWHSYEDHSTWAGAMKSNLTCIGSLDREPWQLGRSGELLCLENRLIRDAFLSGIAQL